MSKSDQPTQDIHIEDIVPLLSPAALKQDLPSTSKSTEMVLASRQAIQSIIKGKDARLLVVVGPCSIHDPEAALDYARQLKKLHDAFQDKLYLMMRVYFEKPRTTVGWKGLINDPDLDGTCNIEKGLRVARRLLIDILEIGLPVATEVLDPIIPQYLADLISWSAIGARTTESQTHREMASGLSMPVGYKNGTEGNLDVAINALQAAGTPHHFLGINQEGQICEVKTKGNPYGHIILRGGRLRSNYDRESIDDAAEQLRKAGFEPALMIDCSHGNSQKRHQNQEKVWKSILEHLQNGCRSVIGMMVESNLFEGNQPLGNRENLKYGVSITDACIGWELTEKLLEEAYKRV